MTRTLHRETLQLNGTRLYCERRGAGPPVVFVSGAFGDADAWQRVSEMLADEFTVVSYDRRANSRSIPPLCWAATTLDEQANDTAALIEHLGLGPAIVWGSNLGGAIVLNLLLRRPDLVRVAILHEPFVPALLDDPQEAAGPLVSATAPHLAAGDFRGAAQAMIKLVGGEEVYAMLPDDQRERMLGNAPTLFDVEFAGLGAFHTEGALTPRVPLTLAVGVESASFLTAGARRLGDMLGADVRTLAGGHVPQATHPEAVATVVRQFGAASSPRSEKA